MKQLILVLALMLSGCGQIASVGDWVNENPLVADIVVRQSVARMIDASDDPAAKAIRIVAVTELAQLYIDGTPEATIARLMEVVLESIDFDRMSLADRMLAQDLLSLIQATLLKKVGGGTLDADSKIGVLSLLTTASRTAKFYAT